MLKSNNSSHIHHEKLLLIFNNIKNYINANNIGISDMMDTIEEIIYNIDDIDIVDKNGMTLLMCCFNDTENTSIRLKIARLLIDYGIDVYFESNNFGNILHFLCTYYSKPNIYFDFLINDISMDINFSKNNNRPIMDAILMKNYDIIEYFYKKGEYISYDDIDEIYDKKALKIILFQSYKFRKYLDQSKKLFKKISSDIGNHDIILECLSDIINYKKNK